MGLRILIVAILPVMVKGFVPVRLRKVPQTTTVGNGFLNFYSRSVRECALSCAKENACDLACFNSDTGTCKLHAWNGVHLKNPTNEGQEASTVIFRRDIRLIRSRSWGGIGVAASICEMFGGEMATYSELSDAFYNHGLHIGTCGWVTSGYMYYALQHQVDGVGYQGINGCSGWKSDGDVFCTVPLF